MPVAPKEDWSDRTRRLLTLGTLLLSTICVRTSARAHTLVGGYDGPPLVAVQAAAARRLAGAGPPPARGLQSILAFSSSSRAAVTFAPRGPKMPRLPVTTVCGAGILGETGSLFANREDDDCGLVGEDGSLDRAYDRLLLELKTLPWTNRQDVKWTLTVYNGEEDGGDAVERSLRSALRRSPLLVESLCREAMFSERAKKKKGGKGKANKTNGGGGLLSNLLENVGTISRYVMVEMICRHPTLMARVLLSASTGSIRTKESQLGSDLDLNDTDLAKITRKVGVKQFRRLNRSKIRELLYYFRTDVALTEEQLRRMILLRPQLLLYSVTNLSAKVRFFRVSAVCLKRRVRDRISLCCSRKRRQAAGGRS